ncbi:hypothetical protein AC249_AIPGENE4251 [Exaiptasia diaphana]|nr:hypothetical protein AC249_AIPGENE4251 [Exaiptasia diaphana]
MEEENTSKVVEKVELLGKEAHKTTKGLNETERIGIGVGIGLVLTFVVVICYLMMYFKGKLSRFKSKSNECAARRDFVSRGDSFISKTTTTLNDLDFDGQEQMPEVELNRPETPEACMEKTSVITF